MKKLLIIPLAVAGIAAAGCGGSTHPTHMASVHHGCGANSFRGADGQCINLKKLQTQLQQAAATVPSTTSTTPSITSTASAGPIAGYSRQDK